jgi:hypothetical protein
MRRWVQVTMSPITTCSDFPPQSAAVTIFLSLIERKPTRSLTSHFRTCRIKEVIAQKATWLPDYRQQFSRDRRRTENLPNSTRSRLFLRRRAANARAQALHGTQTALDVRDLCNRSKSSCSREVRKDQRYGMAEPARGE